MSAAVEAGGGNVIPPVLERADTIYTAISRSMALAHSLYLMSLTTIRQGSVHSDEFRGAVETLAEILEETLEKALLSSNDLLVDEQIKAGFWEKAV